MFLSSGTVGRKAKAHLGPFLSAEGFRPKGYATYWRIRDSLLQFVSLTTPLGQFTVEVAILPLFYPTETWTLAFGGRLGRFVDQRDHWFDTDTEDSLLLGLDQTLGEIREFALPWFDRLDNVRSLVDWYSQGGNRLDGAHGTGVSGKLPIYLAYSHAYLGEFETAIPLLHENLEKAIRPTWRDYQPAVDLLQALHVEPARVSGMLAKWASDSMEKLGLSETR